MKSAVFLLLLLVTSAMGQVLENAPAMYGEADTNFDGLTDLAELQAAVKDAGLPLREEDVERIFNDADTNGDKFLDFLEARESNANFAAKYTRRCAVALYDIALPFATAGRR